MIGLTLVRVGFVVLGWQVGLWLSESEWVGMGLAWVGSLISADFVEHGIRRLVLGYSYNPNVSAQGELEGWTGPTDSQHYLVWRELQFTPLRPWDGDPGSGRFGNE